MAHNQYKKQEKKRKQHKQALGTNLVQRGSGASRTHRIIADRTPSLKAHDIIYDTSRNTVPIVNEEYNLIFFRIAKCASTAWTRFFMRLDDNDNWCGKEYVHPREINKLKLLSDYPIKKAQQMMTIQKWNRVMFVYNPKVY